MQWYQGKEGHWPLTPGTYDVKLMLDDGTTGVLASTQFNVVQ
ncbi:MAG TPA: hypothetical protein VFU82_09275 [Gammaproteobacteria bacterium]|nr:hypothetical protein [Gammaproteobacteria bacterium]